MAHAATASPPPRTARRVWPDARCAILGPAKRPEICDSASEEHITIRKLMASLGFAAVCVALARLMFAPLFLAEPANVATGLLLGAGLFTIAMAAAVRK